MEISIKNHMIYVNGQRVPYRKTPNGGGIIRPEGQVLHHTSSGLSPNGDIGWLTSKQSKASAHTVIAVDGSITQLMALNRKTWHAGRSSYRGRPNCNAFTIGHEIDNPGPLTERADGSFDGIGGPYPAEDVVDMKSPYHRGCRYWLKFSDAQLKTVFALTEAIHRHYGLGFVTTHWEISPGRKVDPGPHFPLEKLRGLLAGRADVEPDLDDRGAPVDGYVRVRSTLNVRAWPNPSSTVIAALKNGTPVNIQRSGVWDGFTWHLINSGDVTGWVHGDYVDLV